MKIRAAVPEDAGAVAQVVRRSIVELCVADHRGDQEILDRWLANKTPETVVRWLTNPKNINLVAVDDCGAIQAAGCVRRDGMVLLNYVSPEARFRGVSKALWPPLKTRRDARGMPGVCWKALGPRTASTRSAGTRITGNPAANSDSPLSRCARDSKGMVPRSTGWT